jgi:hypothetical protein
MAVARSCRVGHDAGFPYAGQVTVHAVAEQAQRAVALHVSLYERLAEVVRSYDEQQIGTLLDYIEQCTRILADETDRLAT